MLTESTVLLVWTSQVPETLVEQLEHADVFVETVPLLDIDRALTVVGPDLVVHVGREGVERVVAVLGEQGGARRVRLVVVAPRASLDELRKLDRSLVASVLPDDLPQKMLVERVVHLAQRSAGAALGTSPRPAVPRPAVLPRPAPAPVPRPAGLGSGASSALGMKVGASAVAKRIAVVDDDVTRADAVAAALRGRGFFVQLLPTDTGRVRWPILRQFSPQALVTDGAGRPPYAWLELLRTDAALQAVRLVTVSYAQLFDEATGMATLAPLLDRITHLGIPGTAVVDTDEDRPTLITEEDRPTLVASDAHRAALESSAERANEPPTAKLDTSHSAPSERESRETIDSIELIESIAPDALESDAPPDDLPTVPLGLPTAELIAATRQSQSFKMESQSFKVETSPGPAHTSDAETPQVPQSSDDTDALLESLTVSSAELARSGSSGSSQHEPLLAESSEGEAALQSHEGSTSSAATRGASRFSDATPIGGAESDAALLIPVVPPVALAPLGAAPTGAKATALRDPRKKSFAGRWLGLSAAVVLLAGGGFWMLRQRGLGVAASSTASQSVATADVKSLEAPPPKPAAEPAPAAAQPEAAEATPADEPGTSPAPWRVPENAELTRCDRQASDYAALALNDVEQASRFWDKARSALMLGDLEKARDLMCRAALMHAESMALEGLAETYLTLGSPEQAKHWVDEAVRLRPDRQKTRELLGDIENQRGRVEASREIWVKAFSIAPEDQKTLDWLSKKLVQEAEGALRAGSQHRAELLYRRAATLSPSNADAPAGLARLALREKQTELATGWVKVAFERAPNHADALVVQGDLALAGGDEESARQSYRAALEKNPVQRQALEQLARLDGVLPKRSSKAAAEPAPGTASEPAAATPPDPAPAAATE